MIFLPILLLKAPYETLVTIELQKSSPDKRVTKRGGAYVGCGFWAVARLSADAQLSPAGQSATAAVPPAVIGPQLLPLRYSSILSTLESG